ncbi:unnamed protein product [Vitrella brassicaformis CCMP3155]|uniref:Phosphatidylethanolamine-binding protein n=2 Tax=Vitrella brassicaformis TaxID=1169539 RepID=A0A0G4G0U7_VITBC|nr:unnamed protein product [Vitrella brassicaformis CCMP3155]|eukprot:CEM21529.1 unnamed protein product [Vitrella brassicaformis CCMP3155]
MNLHREGRDRSTLGPGGAILPFTPFLRNSLSSQPCSSTLRAQVCPSHRSTATAVTLSLLLDITMLRVAHLACCCLLLVMLLGLHQNGIAVSFHRNRNEAESRIDVPIHEAIAAAPTSAPVNVSSEKSEAAGTTEEEEEAPPKPPPPVTFREDFKLTTPKLRDSVADNIMLETGAEFGYIFMIDPDYPNGCLGGASGNHDVLHWWLRDVFPGEAEACAGNAVHLSNNTWQACEEVPYRPPTPAHGMHRYEFYFVDQTERANLTLALVGDMDDLHDVSKTPARSAIKAIRNAAGKKPAFTCGYDREKGAEKCQEKDTLPKGCFGI